MALTGTLVFASGKAGDFDIWSLNLDTQELRQLTRGEYWNDAPRWSPDGNSIAYVSNKSGVPEIWLMAADGSEQRALTTSGKFHANPCWMPDGKSIVCVANYQNADNLDIYRIPLSAPAQTERLVSEPGIDAGPDVSPDGLCLLFSSTRNDNEDIWEHEIGTDSWHRLTTHSARDFAPRYSPDGSKIAFVSERDEHAEGQHSADADVWIMNCDRSDMRKVTANSGSDRFFCWSPDGATLCCCSSLPGKSADRLNFIDVASGARLDFELNRLPLEADTGASVGANWLLRLFPASIRDSLSRMAYPESYFGTERYPDWK